MRAQWVWWNRLLFQDYHEVWRITAPLSVVTIFSFGLAGNVIYRSVFYDPEVRLRPHKKAWHQTESRIQGATKYRHGAFRWYYKTFLPNRWKWEQKRLSTAFEELNIPKE